MTPELIEWPPPEAATILLGGQTTSAAPQAPCGRSITVPPEAANQSNGPCITVADKEGASAWADTGLACSSPADDGRLIARCDADDTHVRSVRR